MNGTGRSSIAITADPASVATPEGTSSGTATRRSGPASTLAPSPTATVAEHVKADGGADD